jgi:hypothetical protein
MNFYKFYGYLCKTGSPHVYFGNTPLFNDFICPLTKFT